MGVQEHWNENLTIEGKLSVPKILLRHPLLAPLFNEGMNWFVWKGSTEDQFPLLADIGQRALNAKYSVQQGQDVFQCFLRACHLWSTPAVRGRSDPALFIQKDILKCNPKCSKDDVESLVEVARKYGGTDGEFAAPLKGFLGAYMHPGRGIASSALQAMANVKLAASEMCPNVIISVLMLLASAPSANVITKGDICGLIKKSDEAQSIESMIRKMISVSAQLGVPSGKDMKILSSFRCELVMKLWGKSKQLEKTTYAQMASNTFKLLLALGSQQIENPWAAPAQQNAGKGKGKGKGKASSSKDDPDDSNAGRSSTTVKSAVEYQDGTVVGVHARILNEKGYKEGCLLTSKGDAGIYAASRAFT